jgi:hypothetical protein
MTNRERMDRWFVELWDKRNAGIIDEMIDPECERHGLPGTDNGPAGFKPFYALFGAAFRRVTVRIEDHIDAGDRIANASPHRYRDGAVPQRPHRRDLAELGSARAADVDRPRTDRRVRRGDARAHEAEALARIAAASTIRCSIDA